MTLPTTTTRPRPATGVRWLHRDLSCVDRVRMARVWGSQNEGLEKAEAILPQNEENARKDTC